MNYATIRRKNPRLLIKLMIKLMLCALCFGSCANAALSPQAQQLSKRLQEALHRFKEKLQNQDITAFNVPSFPGEYADFATLDIPMPILRKASFAFLKKWLKDRFQHQGTVWEKVAYSIPAMSYILRVDDSFFKLLWENTSPQETLLIAEELCKKLWPGIKQRHGMWIEDASLLSRLFLMSFAQGKTPSTDNLYGLLHLLPFLEKLASFYGIPVDEDRIRDLLSKPSAKNSDPNNLLSFLPAIKALVEKEPRLVLGNLGSNFLAYPDIMKSIILKMQPPMPWPKKKFHGFKDEVFFPGMPWDQLVPRWINFLEKQISPQILKAIFNNETISKKHHVDKYKDILSMNNLGYFYQNLPQPKLKEAQQLFLRAAKMLDDEDSHHPTINMNLASMYCAGHGTPVDHQKGFLHFKKALTPVDHQKGFLHLTHRREEPLLRITRILATFVYWFDIPIHERLKKETLSIPELYEVFTHVINQGLPVKNALLQIIVQEMIVIWDLLYKAFHSQANGATHV